MRLAPIPNTLDRLKGDAKYSRIIIAILLFVVAVLAVSLSNKSTTTVLLPPVKIDKEEWVTKNDASFGYKKSWALFAAELIGNVSPGNADFVLSQIQFLFSTGIYRDLVTILETQVKEIKQEQISTRFYAKSVEKHPETNKLFIVGDFETASTSGKTVKSQRTFEFEVEIKNGFPEITFFNAYQGIPQTQGVKK